jgi:NADP-dependent 3-hydroxy acid dehydrogenase YdfG
MANDKKVVLITGAAAGIGLEAVRSLLGSQTSYEILLSGRKLEQAQAAVAQIESEFPSKTSNVVAMEIDVESDASIETAVEQVKAKYGRLDALVNNAGNVLP